MVKFSLYYFGQKAKGKILRIVMQCYSPFALSLSPFAQNNINQFVKCTY